MEDGSSAIRASYSSFDVNRDYSEQERTQFRTAIESAAQEALVEVQVAGAAVASVRVLPWHSRIHDAKRRYLEHSKAWERYLKSAASEASSLDDRAALAEIKATFKIAEGAFKAAVPIYSPFNAEARIQRIFAE